MKTGGQSGSLSAPTGWFPDYRKMTTLFLSALFPADLRQSFKSPD
jgi:hypothetical protein